MGPAEFCVDQENETFIAAYMCAIRREIMIQGRLVITLHSIAFCAKFFKKHISIVIELKDIVDIRKEKTAFLFPNAIVIHCMDDKRFTFYSFLCRDKVYNLIWSIYIRRDICPETVSDSSPRDSKLENPSITDDALFDVTKISLPPEDKVQCEGHPHPGKELISADYPLSAHKLFIMMFMNSDFIKNIFDKLNAFLISLTEWKQEGDSKCRQVIYNLKSNTSFGPILAHIEEEQILEPSTRMGAVYVIRTISRTKGVMYCDSFHTEMLYCITSNSPISSHLRVHAHVIMKPNTFILARKLIVSNGMDKIEEYCQFIRKVISERQGGFSERQEGFSEYRVSENDYEVVTEQQYGLTAMVVNSIIGWTSTGVVANILLGCILMVLLAMYFRMSSLS